MSGYPVPGIFYYIFLWMLDQPTAPHYGHSLAHVKIHMCFKYGRWTGGTLNAIHADSDPPGQPDETDY